MPTPLPTHRMAAAQPSMPMASNDEQHINALLSDESIRGAPDLVALLSDERRSGTNKEVDALFDGDEPEYAPRQLSETQRRSIAGEFDMAEAAPSHPHPNKSDAKRPPAKSKKPVEDDEDDDQEPPKNKRKEQPSEKAPPAKKAAPAKPAPAKTDAKPAPAKPAPAKAMAAKAAEKPAATKSEEAPAKKPAPAKPSEASRGASTTSAKDKPAPAPKKVEPPAKAAPSKRPADEKAPAAKDSNSNGKAPTESPLQARQRVVSARVAELCKGKSQHVRSGGKEALKVTDEEAKVLLRGIDVGWLAHYVDWESIRASPAVFRAAHGDLYDVARPPPPALKAASTIDWQQLRGVVADPLDGVAATSDAIAAAMRADKSAVLLVRALYAHAHDELGLAHHTDEV